MLITGVSNLNEASWIGESETIARKVAQIQECLGGAVHEGLQAAVELVYSSRASWKEEGNDLLQEVEGIVLSYEPGSNLVTFQIGGKWIDFDSLIAIEGEVLTQKIAYHQALSIYKYIVAEKTEEEGFVSRFDSRLGRSLLFIGGRAVVHLDRFDEGDRLIGTGAFKEVFLSIDAISGKLFATSCVDIRKKMTREVEILQEFAGHQRFLQLYYEAVYEESLGNPKACYLFDYCEMGDLFDALERGLDLCIKKNLFEDIIRGVSYMHRKEIIHRDLKVENIFLKKGLEGKIFAVIGDFGLACRFSDLQERKKVCGSPNCLSPEYLRACRAESSSEDRVAATTYAHDVWALGVTLYHTLFDKPLPWEVPQGKVPHRFYDLRASQPKSPRGLIVQMLKVDCLERISSSAAERALEGVEWPSRAL
jgi:hypothetical protein